MGGQTTICLYLWGSSQAWDVPNGELNKFYPVITLTPCDSTLERSFPIKYLFSLLVYFGPSKDKSAPGAKREF